MTAHRINCFECGQFISEKDIATGKATSEDVSDGIEYGPQFYAYLCPKCSGYTPPEGDRS